MIHYVRQNKTWGPPEAHKRFCDVPELIFVYPKMNFIFAIIIFCCARVAPRIMSYCGTTYRFTSDITQVYETALREKAYTVMQSEAHIHVARRR